MPVILRIDGFKIFFLSLIISGIKEVGIVSAFKISQLSVVVKREGVQSSIAKKSWVISSPHNKEGFLEK